MSGNTPSTPPPHLVPLPLTPTPLPTTMDSLAVARTQGATAQEEEHGHPSYHAITPGAVEFMPGPMIRYTPLADISSLPTVLPAPLAAMVTTIATSTRMTLRVTAFLIEAILETSQYSTRMSLGYMRRLLITAISSARRVYLMSTAAMEGDLLSLISGGSHLMIPNKVNDTQSSKKAEAGITDQILGILDKYTNLGIYFIHHTFTMVELFTMSGFFFTSNLIQSAHTAAIESVSLFDSLFGSNESSRSLSAIITMVRKEVLQDERSKSQSITSSLAGLTKALTAFACLQVATWNRTSKRMRMRVLYDCTIQAEHINAYSTAKSASSLENPHPLSIAALEDDKNAVAGPGPSTVEARERASLLLTYNPGLDEANRRLWEHMQSVESPDALRPNIHQSQSFESSTSWSMDELQELLGEADVTTNNDKTSERPSHRSRGKHSTVEVTDEFMESYTVTQLFGTLPPEKDGGSSQPRPFSHRRQLSMPEFAVQALDEDDEDYPIRSSATSIISSPRSGSVFSLDLDPGTDVSAEETPSGDWSEVDNILHENDRERSAVTLASAQHPQENSVGTASYIDAVEHPQHNSERIQVVLKTMTNRLMQRKRTIRHVTTEEGSGDSSRRPSRERSKLGRGQSRGMGWNRPRSRSISGEAPHSTIHPTTPESDTLFTRRRGRLASSFPGRPLSRMKRLLSMSTSTATGPSTPSSSSTETHDPLKSDAMPITPPAEEVEADLTIDSAITQQGLRAPPPSPHQSMTLHLPLETRTSASNTSQRTDSNPGSSVSIRESTHTASSRLQSSTSQSMGDQGAANSDNLFPHEGLIRNIHRFMRYSSAAYGQNFLRILGLGSSDFMFPSTGKHHANSWAFAEHTNIPIDCILLSWFTESSATLMQQEAPPLVHYVAVEHSLQAIVLTCRGTLGFSDVLVDLTCEYQTIHVDQGDPDASYYVHAGMWQSARKLTVKQSTVHETLKDALTKYPTYGLVLAGHSLGGGVAALLAILSAMPSKSFLEQNIKLRKPYDHPRISTPFVTNFESGLPPGRPIHCYAYGPPAVTSPDLSVYAKGLITSVVQDSDLVPTLSLGGIKDFKNIALTLSEEGNIAEEIVGRVIGLNKRKFNFQKKQETEKQAQSEREGDNTSSCEKGLVRLNDENNTNVNVVATKEPEMEIGDEEILSDWMVSLIKTMRADMDNEKLYPPGMVYIMEHFDVYVTDDQPPILPHVGLRGDKKVVHKQAHRVILRQCDSVEERFREPIFAKSMLQNHLPSQYERSTHLLYQGLGQGKL
ncbi:uncharacterized protein I303_105825 [Kwoniella dejecticola CBS 10117]|uniref:sn-1-specific diacylglycerol lipase n=1 Tax=Kwoniella dejecticola CBS 10117 TaxID=1296121 RepID=A0A1A6A0G7_9TREE|nr:uncharacterized protein I303_05847 [Kwoniella dejecticola CBS 10117]OBR83567.1 hypothetical protein I303_05847 [Kwoniella dejecticola CBS 10117]